VPSLTEDLLSSVDQPLTVSRCRKTGRDYLLCDYNRDGDSYRSPWSGEFETPLGGSGAGGVDDQGNNDGAGEGAVPSERSVYFWNLDDGFAGVVLLKKGMRILLFHSYCVIPLNQWLIFSKSCTFGEERGELGFDSCI
jgi:capping protein beta